MLIDLSLKMIHTYKENAGTLEMSKADLELFSLTKIREDNMCSMCRKNIKKNCYCLGKGYTKYCLECSPKVINNVIISIDNYIDVFNKLKNQLDKNKTEFMRHNLANSL